MQQNKKNAKGGEYFCKALYKAMLKKAKPTITQTDIGHIVNTGPTRKSLAS
jgi:hypothetical protein